MENSITPWEGDLLNRKEAARYLMNFLVRKYRPNSPEKGFVMAVNAEWGFGKTFLLENWKLEAEQAGYGAVYFNAWENDFTSEPLIAFISELNTSLSSYFNTTKSVKKAFNEAMSSMKVVLGPVIKTAATIAAKKAIGVGIDELRDHFDSVTNEETSKKESEKVDLKSLSKQLIDVADKALKDHNNSKNAIKLFKAKLSKLIEAIEHDQNSIHLPLFIFIDELDRCRPNYALQLLEGIKHLFGVKGVYFIVATNIDQLSESVKAIYGNGFDGEKYLKRFFDLQYLLPPPSNLQYARGILNKSVFLEQTYVTGLNYESPKEQIDAIPPIFEKYSSCFKLGLRDQNQVVNIMEAALLSSISDRPIHIHFLLALAMAYQRSPALFNEMIAHKGIAGVGTKYELNHGITFSTRNTGSSANRTGAQKNVSIIDVISLYFTIASSSDTERAIKRYSDTPYDFPATLLDQMDIPPRREKGWLPNYMLYINAVRHAGGFSSSQRP